MKKDLKFEIYNDGEFYCAKCFNADIFTQGETLDKLYYNIKEAVNLYFEEPDENLSRDDFNGILAVMEFGF